MGLADASSTSIRPYAELTSQRTSNMDRRGSTPGCSPLLKARTCSCTTPNLPSQSTSAAWAHRGWDGGMPPGMKPWPSHNARKLDS